ncbi:MAG: hypothetical protein AB1705_09435 [Verrucomicrobiota bacterium]
MRIAGQTKRVRGIMLIECLVYAGVFLVIIGLASGAFLELLKATRQLRRNADDIARAVHAGERWREDVRRSQVAPLLVDDTEGARLVLRHAAGEVAYVFEAGDVWRTAAPENRRELALSGVRRAVFAKDTRTSVTAWRWELELESKERSRVRPLFSFCAVAGK